MRLFWGKLSGASRAGLVACAALIMCLTFALAYRVLRTDYQVLFSELAAPDAAAMTAELDRLKMPYKLSDDGTSILVDQDQVHKTRMKLMGKELPLRGAVGFELFNNSDFGMTEFAQKINYQRALQGEITRTILSLNQIKDARVILVMPEQGLFKQAASKAKASITLSLKQGQALRPEQVTGIQRLVSASVPGISTQEVTILDQNGIALSRHAGVDGELDAGSGRLDLKRETENHLSRKAAEILERTFGPGQASVSVDVVLNMERAQITTEDLVVPPGPAGQAATGVVVRERQTLREGGGNTEIKPVDSAAPQRAGTSQREVEYAVGRRVEQIVSHPGGIRKLQAVAVVRRTLDAAQQEQIRKVLAAAVGASAERGDTVVVHTLEVEPVVPGSALPVAAASATRVASRPDELRGGNAQPDPGIKSWLAMAFAPILGVFVAALLLFNRRRRVAGPPVISLNEAQRRVALANVQAWLAADTVGSNTGTRQ
jgi:flagellar M-ring protein FliF